MEIKKVGVVGCGLMGSGIVQVAAQAGFETVVIEANEDLLQRGIGRIKQTLDGLVEKTKIDAKTRDAMAGHSRTNARPYGKNAFRGLVYADCGGSSHAFRAFEQLLS